MSRTNMLRGYFGLIGLLSILLAFGCEQPKSLQEYEFQALQLLEEGKARESMILLKNGLATHGESPMLRLLLAETFLMVNMGTDALIEADKALARGAPPLRASLVKSKALILEQRYDEAAELLQSQVFDEAEGRDAVARKVSLAEVKLRTGEIDAADAVLATIDAADFSLEASILRARIRAGQGQAAEAIASLGALQGQGPTFGRVSALLGDLYRATQDFEKAAAAYSNALDNRYDSEMVYWGLALANFRLGRLDALEKNVKDIERKYSGSVAAIYLKGLDRLSKKDFGEALGLFQEAHNLAPDLIVVRYALGVAHAKLEEYESAVTHLRSYLGAAPNNRDASLLLATVLILKKEAEKAEPILSDLLRVYPGDADATRMLRAALLSRNDLEGARKLLDGASVVHDDAALLLLQSAVAKSRGGEMEQVEGLLTRALAKAPDNLRVLLELVNVQFKKGDLDAAQTTIDRMFEVAPEDPVPHTLQASIHLANNDRERAIAAFRRSLDKDASFTAASVGLAQVFADQGEFDRAREILVEAVEAAPGFYLPYVEMAKLIARQDDLEGYREWLGRAIVASPKSVVPRTLLLRSYLRSRDYAKAAEFISKPAPEAARDDNEYLHVAGITWLDLQQPQRAHTAFAILTKREPANPSNWYFLATAQRLLGRNDEARVSLDRALELEPDSLSVLTAMIDLEIAEGNLQRAADLLVRIGPLDTKKGVYYRLSARLKVAEGDLNGAAALYEKVYERQPTVNNARNLIGAYQGAGQTAKASGRAEQLLGSHPDSSLLQVISAELLAELGQSKAAIERYRRVVKKEPDNLAAWNNLALLLAEQRSADARAAADRALTLAPGNPEVIDTWAWITHLEGNSTKAMEAYRAVSERRLSASAKYHYAVVAQAVGQTALARTLLEGLEGKDFAEREDATRRLDGLRR